MDIYRYLAEQTTIPEPRMITLFNHKSAQIPLAARVDLPVTLTDKIIKTPELITYWAATPNRNSEDLSIALQTLLDNQDPASGLRALGFSALATQEKLEEDDIEKLIDVANENITQTLLQRKDLTSQHLIKLYSKQLTYDTKLSNNILREHLSSSKELVTELLERPDLPITLLDLIAEYWTDEKEIANKIIKKLTDLNPTQTENNKTSLRIQYKALSNPYLTKDDLLKVLLIPTLSLEDQIYINERITKDYAEMLNKLDCKMGYQCNKKEHLAFLTEIKSAKNKIQIPTDKILDVILAHFKDLDSTCYSLTSPAKVNDIRAYAKKLYDNKHYQSLKDLVTMQNTSALDQIPDASPVITLLAKEGSKTLLHSRYLLPYADNIIHNFQPINLLISDKHYLSLILDTIDSQPPKTAEIAISLLGEWNSDLPTLINSAISLT